MFGSNEQIEIVAEDSSGVFQSSLLPNGTMPWRGLVGSIAVHTVLVPLLALGFEHVVRPLAIDDAVQITPFRQQQVFMLRLPPDLVNKPDPPKKKVEARKVAPKTPKPPAPAKAVEVAAAKPAAKPFTMPKESVPAPPAPVILQPPTLQAQVTKLPDMELPTITMVAPAPPKPRKVFDVGSLEKKRSMPTIKEPGLMPEPPPMMVSTVPIRPSPVGVVNPKLPVYAAPAPLQTIEAKDKTSMSAGGAVVANPANLVMNSPTPIPAQETVSAPAVIALPRGGTGTAIAGTAPGAATSEPGNGTLRTARAAEAKAGASKGGAEESKGAGKGAPKPDAGAAAGSAKALADAAPQIRILHPSNGLHEVTVVQSGVDHILPAVRGLLEGDPVYTVYLNVGWTREWVMHFCVPRQGPPLPKQVGGVVSLSSPPALKAPYPMVTLAPQQRLLPPVPIPQPGVYVAKPPPFLFHGYLESRGKFDQMKQHGTDLSGFAEKVLKSLEGWELRPATQGGGPVRVQVILVVPVA